MHGGVRGSDPFPLLSLLLTVAAPLSIDFFPTQSYAEVKIKMAFNFFGNFINLIQRFEPINPFEFWVAKLSFSCQLLLFFSLSASLLLD